MRYGNFKAKGESVRKREKQAAQWSKRWGLHITEKSSILRGEDTSQGEHNCRAADIKKRKEKDDSPLRHVHKGGGSAKQWIPRQRYRF